MKRTVCALLVILMTFSCVLLTGCSKKDGAKEEISLLSDADEKPGDAGVALDKEKELADGEYGAVGEDELACIEASDKSGGSGGGNGSGEVSKIDILPGTLTCGEWNDNKNFDFFKTVLEREEFAAEAEKWGIRPTHRFRVSLSNGQTPAKNVVCSLKSAAGEHLGTAVTDASGEAYIYYDLAGGNSIPATLVVGDLRLPISDEDIKAGGKAVDTKDGQKYDAVDIMFVVDTTGSMGDELEYLKKELADVTEKVAKENAGLDIRVGLTFYRDEEDEYVTRSFDFDGDIGAVCKNLDAQFSDGGGDYPEAVHTALEEALHGDKATWRDNSVKLVFFVLDAPAHEGTEDSLRASMTEAATNGKRIIPVASSGVDTQTEFLLRSMASVTGGTYVFLTDDSGVGDSHLEPTVGDYDVKMLNDMLVNIINGYCR